eukprot:1160720-Pelagomonas_calceolata.AAC.14
MRCGGPDSGGVRISKEQGRTLIPGASSKQHNGLGGHDGCKNLWKKCSLVAAAMCLVAGSQLKCVQTCGSSVPCPGSRLERVQICGSDVPCCCKPAAPCADLWKLCSLLLQAS